MEKNKNNKPKKTVSLKTMLISLGATLAVSIAASTGITFALASTQLKLPSYTVTFLNWDGSVLETQKVSIGSEVKYKGQTPTRPTENYVDYTFKGWNKSTLNIIADTEITAEYDSTRQTYEMTWYDSDGKTVLESKTLYKDDIASGKAPEYTGKTPTKADEGGYQYIFSGWLYPSDQGWKDGHFKATATYNQAQQDLKFAIGEKGVTITGYTGTATTVTIPEEWAGKPVTTIGSDAFSVGATTNNTAVISITIPKSITTIQERAFNNASSLKTVTFKDGSQINSFPSFAFSNCSSLESFIIPDSITTMGNKAFSNCPKLKTVKFGKNLGKFEQDAFDDCPLLESIDVASTNTYYKVDNNLYPGLIFSIDWKVLIKCLPAASFSNVLPSTIEVVTSMAFQGCKKIGDISFENCNNLWMIDSGAFKNSSITSFNSGNHLTELGADLFEGCEQLESITIGKGIDPEGVEWDSFTGCKNLKEIKISSDNESFETVNGMVYDKTDTENHTLLRCPIACPVVSGGTSLIKSDCKAIGDYAFQGCTELTEFVLPSSIESIGDRAFLQCPNLSKITLGTGALTTLGEEIFYGCTSLKEIVIGKQMAFSGKLNAGVWGGCSSIEKITVDPDSTWFKSIDGVLYGYDPSDTEHHIAWLLRYPPASKGTSFIIPNEIEINGETLPVEKLGRMSFDNASYLTQITLAKSITQIYDYVFQLCTNLETLNFEPGFKIQNTALVGNNIFYKCEKLNKVVVKQIDGTEKNTIMEISSRLPIKYTPITLQLSLSTSTIPSRSVNSKYISNLIIDDYPTTIGEYAFADCDELKTASLPKSVTTIGQYAFSGCSKLKTMVLQEGLETVEADAFLNCNSWENITLPDSLKTVGQAAFGGCGKMTSIDLNKVENISQYSFGSCSSLESVILPTTLKTIPKYAFNNNKKLTSVTFNGTVEEYYALVDGEVNVWRPFTNCDNLHQIRCIGGGKEEFIIKK